MAQYCIYLRKSRADAEAEQRGEGETLARHEHTLVELAKRQNLTIVKVYREIVSGDSIAARPQMQQLLQDIASNLYTGVIVMEIERLARGDTIDQGIVAQAFRESGTKIVTPTKTYDPTNEFDEEYFEFSLFMSRREYKTIKRRMQAGRVASIKEGNYIGTNAPYGYRKISPKPKVKTLEIVPEEAETIRMIFELFTGGMGAKAIATHLNQLQIPPQKSSMWEPVSIRKILKSPIYAGKIVWKTKMDGIIEANGLHEAIISYETFLNAREKAAKRAPQVPTGYTTQNYYHNILFCANCGRQMKRRPTANGGQHMLCYRQECRGKTVSASIQHVDAAVISAIRFRIQELLLQKGYDEANEKETDKSKKQIAKIEKALDSLKKQKEKLHTLLETDVYSVEVFLERSGVLESRKAELENELKNIKLEAKQEHIPRDKAILWLKNIVDNFEEATPEEKNKMLLRVIRRIEYSKTEKMCKNKRSSDLNLHVEFL